MLSVRFEFILNIYHSYLSPDYEVRELSVHMCVGRPKHFRSMQTILKINTERPVISNLNITLCLAILCRSFLCRSVGNRQGPQRLLTVYCQTISNKKLQVLHVHISTILDSSISLCHSFHLFWLLFTSCHSTVNKRIICTNIYTHTHTHARTHTHTHTHTHARTHSRTHARTHTHTHTRTHTYTHTHTQYMDQHQTI